MICGLVACLGGAPQGVQAQTAWSPEEAARWSQLVDQIKSSNDPADPFASYFTPPFSKAGAANLTWSMMATRWRDTGAVNIQVGIRLVHAGTKPWRITGGRIAGGSLADTARSEVFPAKALKPLINCYSGACRNYEAASLTLPLSALATGAEHGLEISVLTEDGEDTTISFPQAIVSALYLTAKLDRLTIITP